MSIFGIINLSALLDDFGITGYNNVLVTLIDSHIQYNTEPILSILLLLLLFDFNIFHGSTVFKYLFTVLK